MTQYSRWPVVGGGTPGMGTVTSVGLTVPSFLTIAGTPVTTSGTIAVGLAAEPANTVFAGPASGGAAAPTFRALVAADIPSLAYVTAVTASSPLFSSGGTTPNLTIQVANGSQNGYLSSADWVTFDSKFSLPALTAGSVLFSDGTTIAQDNANFFWDETSLSLRVGDQSSLSGDLQAAVSAVNIKTDPSSGITVGVLGVSDLTLTDDSGYSSVGGNFQARTNVAAGKTQTGPVAGVFAAVSRTNAADEGTVNFAGGVVSSLTQNSPAKTLNSWASYISGFHNIDAATTVGSMADYLSFSTAVPVGVITSGNFYGVFIQPDSNYVKQNWLSGTVLLGGSSYSAPTETVHVDGNFSATKNTVDVDEAGPISSLLNSHTTVDGSVGSTGYLNTVNALVDAGATNNKVASGVTNLITRGDGTDDGTLEAIAGSFSIIKNNSGASGVTTTGYGYASILITQQGTLTDFYDFFSQRSAAGGTLTNHYGVYISNDTTTPVQNWLSGSTVFGPASYAAPNANSVITIQEGHIDSKQATPPVIAIQANAGTGSSASIAQATDIAGQITIVTGTIGISTGAYAQVTFDKPYAVAPIVVLTPAGATLSSSVYVTSTATDFTINFAVAGGISATYVINYMVIETVS